MQLREANVLPKHKNVAPALAANALELEKALKRDKLSNAIQDRPSRAQLKDANLLPAPVQLAPALASKALALEKALKKDAINSVLQKQQGSADTDRVAAGGVRDAASYPRQGDSVPAPPPLPSAKPSLLVGTSHAGDANVGPHANGTPSSSGTKGDLEEAIDGVRACLREVREFRGWLQAQ